MFDPKTGIYYYSIPEFENESSYHFEHTYYIQFNSKKALYLIDQLYLLDMCSKDAIFHSHVFIDAIFQSAGLILNRFRCDKATGNNKKQIDKNRKEYEFDEIEYPLLSDRDFRNFIEHIEEKDQKLIDNNIFFGTFNVIYPNLDSKMKTELLNSNQNNLLDLERKTYSILLVKGKTHQVILKTINLDELRSEFQKIYDRSCTIWNYIQNGEWG